MNYKTRTEFHLENNYILATIKRRFFAFFIDWIILIMIYCLLIILLHLFNFNISKVNIKGVFDIEMEMNNMHSFLFSVLKFLLGLLPIIYFSMLFYFGKGQTIGKYFLRIKVVSLYHEHLGLWHCIERSLGYFASALEFGFGYLQAFWNPNRMSLHDKIGETIVIQHRVKKRK